MGPLLCELHSHTRWSDGDLTVAELVDLHGRNGFDVLCVTDHVVRSDDPWREREGFLFSAVDEHSWGAYLAEIEREAARSWSSYGMLVIPGLELTFNDDDAAKAAHAVAFGLRSFVSVDGGIAEAMKMAAEAGAAIIAAHPYNGEPAPGRSRVTQRFALDEGLRGLAHRFELFNRTQLFGWVAEMGLPAVDTSTAPSTSSAGRRSSRAATTSPLSSTTSARGAPCISPDSTESSLAPPPRGLM